MTRTTSLKHYKELKSKGVNVTLVTKQDLNYKGKIDDSFTEVNLSGFLQDNPDLISNLKKKYGIGK